MFGCVPCGHHVFSKVRSNIIKTENVDLYEERLKFILIFCLGKQGEGVYFENIKIRYTHTGKHV